MKIYYESIEEGGLDLDRSFEFDTENDHYNLTLFNGNIDKAGEMYLLTGRLMFTFSSICDRCLDDVKLDFVQDIMQVISPLGDYPMPKVDNEEVGLSDEEADLYVTPKDHIDIDEFLREEMLLSSPIKRLCMPDCKGICSKCGASLNKGDCGCSKDKEDDIHWSGLEKLKDLKDKR